MGHTASLPLHLESEHLGSNANSTTYYGEVDKLALQYPGFLTYGSGNRVGETMLCAGGVCELAHGEPIHINPPYRYLVFVFVFCCFSPTGKCLQEEKCGLFNCFIPGNLGSPILDI